jgi:hypothetical protein
MDRTMDSTDRFRTARRRARACVAFAAAMAIVGVQAARPATAGDAPAFEARAGLALAAAAAASWAPDAALVWVENDENPGPTGASERWGYLFYSASAEKARAYSVGDGKIVTAENLDLAFDAPPLAGGWIDSGAAFAAAEESKGRAFRNAAPARLKNMLLTRGTMDAANPDRTTWTLVYATPTAPSLFVVVDAQTGKVVRTWRG